VRKTGDFETVASPIRLGSGQSPLSRPPALGEQTEKIRKEFGLP
jgi:crotonobetainyl-CoA:carnitine CoA-transferase CaiB-like acyl-CoA transferase